MCASCLATSVFPTPVGPENRKQPIGFSGWPKPERESLIVLASVSMAVSCPKTTSFKSRVKILQLLLIRRRNAAGRNLGDLGDDFFNIFRADRLLALVHWKNLDGRADFVDNVDGFIRQLPVIDVLGRKLDRRSNGRGAVVNTMMFLVMRL